MVRSRKLLIAAFLLFSCIAFAQQPPAPPAVKGPKLCVAAVGNGSLQPILVNDVKAELMKGLLTSGLNAYSTSSATLVAKKLELSGNNRESIHLRSCDYMLLTSVDSRKAIKAAAGTPESGSATASGNDLLLSFALFKTNVAKPLIDTAVEGSSASAPTQAILDVVARETDQVHTAMTRK